MNRKVYDKIVKASGIQKGDMVIIQYWMNEQLSEDVQFLQAAIAGVGASPLLILQQRHMNQQIFESATEGCYDEKYFSIYENADAVIDLVERPIALLENMLEEKQMQIGGAYMQKMFQLSSTRKKMIQLRVPTKQNADAEGLPADEFENRIEQAMDIDYDALYKICEQKKNEVSNATGVTICTGKGNELHMFLENRKWFIDAGDGDLPCGEIYIAPIENKTNGTIFFDTIYITNPTKPSKREKFEQILFTVKDGKITNADNEKVQAFLEECEAGDSTVCELGIGLNEHVTSLCGCALLDEKMIDTFHIAIGDNTMFGGENEAQIHMDFIGKGDLKWNK